MHMHMHLHLFLCHKSDSVSCLFFAIDLSTELSIVDTKIGSHNSRIPILIGFSEVYLFLNLLHNYSIYFCVLNWPICGLCEGNYVVNYLATRGSELQSFVTGSLIQLLCRITKYGWLEEERFREITKEATNFLSQVHLLFSWNELTI